MNVRTLGEFRQLTAKLPGNTPLLTEALDHCYDEVNGYVTTAIALPDSFDPDYGDDPELYGLSTEGQVKLSRRTVVVVV